MSDKVLTPPPHTAPTAFTRAQLDWLPWLEPLAVEAMTERHLASLVDAARVKSPYFRLLARDPDALEARTLTDKDIFYNSDAGLPRAERELAATATSRLNGCLYCASVHARHAATYSKREADVERLLDDGVAADLGERWNAIVAASVALTATPSAFGPEHVDRLRRAGLDDLAIADVIHAAAFFGWANRLMLSLGEPTAPAGAVGAVRRREGVRGATPTSRRTGVPAPLRGRRVPLPGEAERAGPVRPRRYAPGPGRRTFGRGRCARSSAATTALTVPSAGVRAPVGREGRHEPLGALAVERRHGRADRRPLDGRGPEQPGGSRELRASERRLAEHLEAARDPEAVVEVRPDHEALAGEVLRLVEIASPQGDAAQREERAADAPPVAEVSPERQGLGRQLAGDVELAGPTAQERQAVERHADSATISDQAAKTEALLIERPRARHVALIERRVGQVAELLGRAPGVIVGSEQHQRLLTQDHGPLEVALEPPGAPEIVEGQGE